MQFKQDSDQPDDLNPFSLKNLKRPIPPRQRPKSKSFLKVWIVVILLILALIGGAGYECCHYLIDQSKSAHQIRSPQRVIHRKNTIDFHLNKHRRHPRIQIKQQPVQNERTLGRTLDRKRVNLRIADQVLKTYERHTPQVQYQFYDQAMNTCKNENNPERLNDWLQRLCKKVNEM